MDMEIIIEVCTSQFCCKRKTPFKLQQNFMFHGNEIKWQNKICNFPRIKFVVFYYRVSITFFTSSKLCPSKKSSSSSPNLRFLGNPESHHYDSKLTRIQNSKLQCSIRSPCPKCPIHPNHVIILPP